MKKILSSFYIFISLLYGCSTDFDVIAPYKEVMVVDGLLNALDSIQYIRVSKAFLGEGNAYIMAQQKDSVNYADVLDVKLERILNNQVLESAILSRTELNNKDSGIFSYPFHVLYSTNQEIHDEDNSEYRVTVTNRSTGIIASSKTKIVKDMQITPTIQPIVDWTGPAPVIITFNPNPVSESHARVFDMNIRFHYREIDPSGNSIFKSINWDFTDQITANKNLQEVRYDFRKNDFFKNIGSNIPEIPGYTRRIDSLPAGYQPFEIILLQGTEDLLTYINLQRPSTGIVQERPLFTTVENGLGIFTSRIVRSEFRTPSSTTEQAFDTCVFTRDLNFEF